MALLNFICIGAQKAGTSWLFEVLGEHPQVWLAPFKEVHFFDRVHKNHEITEWERIRLRRGVERELSKGSGCNHNYVEYLNGLLPVEERTIEWYRQVYSWQTPPGVARGEITPSYLDLSEERLAYAREVLGNVKVILIVRSPLDRELSQLRMRAMKATGKKGKQLETDEQWAKFYRNMKRSAGRGSYETGIPLWERYFGAENMLILPFGDIREQPENFIETVESFLGVPHFREYSNLRQQIHATKKLTIPPIVQELAMPGAEQEMNYLQSRFNPEFLCRIK